MDHFTYRNSRLWCEQIPATDIADGFGTPTYVYSAATLRDHVVRLRTAFAALDPLICYSIKSCGNLSICRLLADLGCGMDAVSGGEVERAWLAGCPMSKIVYAGVGKTDPEIKAALDGRHSLLQTSTSNTQTNGPIFRDGLPSPSTRGPIGWFNIESEQEFETIAAIARELGVTTHAALRVNPDVDPKTHAYTTTGKKETKFGVDLERALAFFDRYGRNEFLRLDAIHIHLGSPIYTTQPYIEGITKVLALIDEIERRGIRIDAIDLGGGFGADYETDRSPLAVDYAAAITPLLRTRASAGTRIILEPGRTISANAGILLTRVLYVKEGGTKRFIITDAGMNTLLRPSLYGSFHFMWPVAVSADHVPPRRAEQLDLPGLHPCDVVGPICETGDFLAKDRPLPPVKRGDLLAVFTAGAYGMTMASNYNTQPLPAEVLVDADHARIIRQRQTIADILAPEHCLPPHTPS